MRPASVLFAAVVATAPLVVVLGQDTAPVTSPSRTERAPDLVAPRPELAALLERFDEEAEPGRELKRAFVSVVAYLLAGDVDRALPYFHPDLRFHVGAGDLVPMPPARLAEQLKGAEASRLPVADVLDLSAVRAYSRARAAEVDPDAEGWTDIAPANVAKLMLDGDWLVMARLKAAGFGAETFYVFRKDGARYKVVLAE